MLELSDVNSALLCQAVDELEIGVPIRAYEVVKGRLVLHLAYTLEPAVWEPPSGRNPGSDGPDGRGGSRTAPTADDGRPAAGNVREIPAGDLNRLLKPRLQELARSQRIPRWNRLRKAELVAALEDLRVERNES